MTFKFFTTEGQTDVPGCFFHHDFLGTHGSVENFLCENYTFWHDFLIDWPFKSVNISYMYMVHLIENCEILCIISKQSCISYIFPVINQYFLWTMSLHPRMKKQPVYLSTFPPWTSIWIKFLVTWKISLVTPVKN